MGFAAASKKIEFKSSYTVESLFEAIKDKQFTAGKPELIKQGVSKLIVFPPLNRKNQIWITKKGMGKETTKFLVSKQEQAGFGNLMANSLTSGGLIGGMAEASTAEYKRCVELVEITANEIMAMGF